MADPQEQMRQAARDVRQELTRAIESGRQQGAPGGGRRLRASWATRASAASAAASRTPRPSSSASSPLRDEGLITEEEFQAKKAELLSRM